MGIRDKLTNLFGTKLPDEDLCLYRHDDVTSEQRVGICSVLIERGDPAMRARYLNGRAVAYRDLKNVEAAKADFDRGLALEPNYVTMLHNRAVLLDEEGDYEASLADADRVIALEPDDARGYVDRADACYSLRDFDNALAAIDRALALEAPTDVRLYIKGRTLVQMGRYEDAIAPLSAAIELDPDYRNAIERREAAYAMLGDRDAQLRDIERLVALDPDDADAQASLAMVLALSDPDRALIHCDRVFAQEPDRAPSYDLRASIMERKGDLAAARADQDKAVELWPHEPTFRSNRAITRINDGDFDGAQADLDEGLASDPERPSLLTAKAHLAMIRGESELSGFLIAGILSEHPDDPAAICVSGLQRLMAEDNTDACERFEHLLAVRFNPRFEIMGVRLRWTAHYGRGLARARLGDAAGAAEDFAAAAALRLDVDEIFRRWGFSNEIAVTRH